MSELSTTNTFSNYRVDCVEPSDPEHKFETRCHIVADDARLNGDTVRVFDVPDPNERQRAVAEFACKALNSHNALLVGAQLMIKSISFPMTNKEAKAYDALMAAVDAAR